MIAQNALAKALHVLGRVVPKRPISPSTGGVWIDADDGVVRLLATDLQCLVQVALPAEVHVPGQTIVMARTFANVVSTLGDGDVLLSLSGSRESLRITSGPTAIRLSTMSDDENPFSMTPSDYHLETSADHVVDLIQRTTFCATDSDELSPFAGVYVFVEDQALTMAATDNYQLAYYSLPASTVHEPDDPDTKYEAVLPTTALTLFARALAHFRSESVRIKWGERSTWFFTDQLVCQIRRLDVAYPDLKRYMGVIAGVHFDVEKDRLLEAVRQVSSIGEDEHRPVCLTVDGDRLHLASAPQELGEAHTAIQLKRSYPRRRVWLDAKRLVSGLRVLPSDEVMVYVSEPLAPVALAPVDPLIRFRTVVTPLRYGASEVENVV